MTAGALTGSRARSPLLALARALRPYQWPKSLIVFAAFAFSAGEAWTLEEPGDWWPLLWRSALLFLCWCGASSATYLVNDVHDADLDRLHPRKRFRPIAAGEVSPNMAQAVALILGCVSLVGALVLDTGAGLVVAGYLAVMVAYSWALKAVPVLDVIILSAGLVARAVSGAFVIDVHVSPWLYVCTSFGAFFVAVSKRWAEARDLGPEAASHRPSLAQYTPEVLNHLLVIGAAGALLSYSIYTIESDHVPTNGAMAATIPFVAFAMFRYLLLLAGSRRSDAPDRILFTDPQVLAAVAGFAVVAIWVLLAN